MDKWWADGEHRLALGVFQGGGAKGIAYAGALQAFAQEKYWFSQVAGSSAGAITAVLVAAGVHTNDLEDLTADALRRVRKPALRLAIGTAEGVFTNRRLGAWLDAQLRERTRTIDGPAVIGSSPVTFAELERASGIACHVVVLDLATGTPMVFCGALTPDAAVVDAVLASSAIPGGLNPGRAIMNEPTRPVVHHLVDGGAWANFPTFVFRDAGWRRWAFDDSETVCDTLDAPLFGFTVNGVDSTPPTTKLRSLLPHTNQQDPQFDLGAGRSADSYVASAVSWVLGAHLLRGLALLATIALGYALYGHLPEIILDWSDLVVGHWPLDRMAPLLFIAGAAAILAGAFAAIAMPLGILLLGRILAFSVLPSIRAAMGVATKAPPWAGAMPDATVVNLVVDDAVRTTSFGLGSTLRRRVISKARKDTLHHLTTTSLQPPLVRSNGSGRPDFHLEAERGAESLTCATDEQGESAREATTTEWTRNALAAACHLISAPYRWIGNSQKFGFVAAGVLGLVAAFSFCWVTIEALKRGSAMLFLGASVLAVLALATAGRPLQSKAQARAAGRKVGRGSDLAMIGVATVVFALLSGWFAGAVDHANQPATITRASEAKQADRALYEADLRTGGQARFETPVQLRVGEKVRLQQCHEGMCRLAGVPDATGEFVLAAAFGLMAFGVLLLGADEFWYRRFRRAVGGAD